jgi:xylulokinase
MFIGIDMGTSSTKAVLFDDEGNQKASASQDYEYKKPEQGQAVHDPQSLEEALFETLKELGERIDLSDVEGIGVTSFGRVFLPLDSDKIPLSNVILSYIDERIDNVDLEVPELNWGNSTLYKQIEYLKNQKPEIYTKMSYIVDFRDYIGYLLTGELRRNDFGYPQDKMDEINEKYEVDNDLFPDSNSFRTSIGTLKEELVELTDIGSGAEVVVGPWDAICSVIGSGLNDGSKAMAVSGTTTIVAQVSEESSKGANSFYNEKGLFLGAESTGSAEEWLTDLLDINYQEVNSLIKDAKHGEEPVIVPFFEGERENPGFKGAITQLTTESGKKSLAMSCVEAEAYYIKHTLQKLQEKDFQEVEELRISGGRAQNDKRNQIKADILQKPVKKLKTGETSALGAAILATITTNQHQSLEEATNNMVQTTERYTPNTEKQEKYNQRFQQYKKLYKARKDIN